MSKSTDSFRVKIGLAEMLKGGVILDVTTAEQAKIANDDESLRRAQEAEEKC